MIKPTLRKNILDLEYNKYLQYYTTSIILLFTYVIGIAIALLTRQIDYNNSFHMVFSATISFFIIIFVLVLISNFRRELIIIPKEIMKLEEIIRT